MNINTLYALTYLEFVLASTLLFLALAVVCALFAVVRLRAHNEKVVRELNKRILHQNAEIARQSSDAALGRLASHMAHDIRSPLSVISLAAQQAKSTQAETLIKQAVLQLNSIAQEVLDTRKLLLATDSGAICNLRQTIESVVDVKRSTLPKKVNFSIWGETVFITWNKVELIRVLTIVVDNAVEAVDSGGSIDIGVISKDGENIKLIVRDDGVGFPKNFNLSKPSSTKAQGNALGLVYVIKSMKELGGSVAVQNVPPKGAEVTLEFPPDVVEASPSISRRRIQDRPWGRTRTTDPMLIG